MLEIELIAPAAEAERVDPSFGVTGRKSDGGKPAFHLIPPGPLFQLAELYEAGAQKYKPRNWELGISWGRIFAAIMRHLWAFWGGEELDPETGIPHPIHAAWGCLALVEYMTTHRELDDRSK